MFRNIRGLQAHYLVDLLRDAQHAGWKEVMLIEYPCPKTWQEIQWQNVHPSSKAIEDAYSEVDNIPKVHLYDEGDDSATSFFLIPSLYGVRIGKEVVTIEDVIESLKSVQIAI